MRDLTLHEKITIKGIFARFGAQPRLDMQAALYFCPRFFGRGVGQLVQLRKSRPERVCFYHKAKRTYISLQPLKRGR